MTGESPTRGYGGRPKLPPEERRRTLSVRVLPDILGLLEDESAYTGVSKSRIVEEAILALVNSRGVQKHG